MIFLFYFFFAIEFLSLIPIRNLIPLSILAVEPRPFDSDRMKEPVYSVLGNPDPVRLACAFTGYPPPEVWIEKNGSVVATGIESVWVELTTDSLDNYGVYYCVAENVVSRSKLNYTFEIKRSGLLDSYNINVNYKKKTHLIAYIVAYVIIF